MKRKLVATLACRNQGSRLYGKPVQNLNIEQGIRIIDQIISCLQSIEVIDEVILAISEGTENTIFQNIANEKGLRYIVGDQHDVLLRLVQAGEFGEATDIFRVTSESPFPYFVRVKEAWDLHVNKNTDGVFLDDIVDGCGFEILALKALKESHKNGDERHRSELCTLYMRENHDHFNILKIEVPIELVRKDIRLTVDNPEDLIVCREVYNHFIEIAPKIPLESIVQFLDERKKLKELVAPYTEIGYQSMYQWGKDE